MPEGQLINPSQTMYNLLLPSPETSRGLTCAGVVEKRRERRRKGERSQPLPMEKKVVIANDAFYGREEMPSSRELWPLPSALAT